MIVVDTSVIVAIVRNEDDASIWIDVLDQTPRACMSAVSYVETQMVMMGRRIDLQPERVDEVIGALAIEISPVTLEQGRAAVASFRAYGKGRHRARLSLADCFAYALAKTKGLPLLFKGDAFLQTDILPAWRP